MSIIYILPLSLYKYLFYSILISLISYTYQTIQTSNVQRAIAIPIQPNQTINTLFTRQHFLYLDDIQFYYQNTLLDKSHFEISEDNKEIFLNNNINDNKNGFEGFQLINEENIYNCSFSSKISNIKNHLIWLDVFNIVQQGKYFFGINGKNRDHLTCFTLNQNGIIYLTTNDSAIRVSRIFEGNENVLLAINGEYTNLFQINRLIENNVLKSFIKGKELDFTQNINYRKIKNLKLRGNYLIMIMNDKVIIFIKNEEVWEYIYQIYQSYNDCESTEKYLICMQSNQLEFFNIETFQNYAFEINSLYPWKPDYYVYKLIKVQKANSIGHNIGIQIIYINQNNSLNIKEIILDTSENDFIETEQFELIKEINIPLIANETNIQYFDANSDLTSYFWYNQTHNKYYIYNYESDNNHHLFTLDLPNEGIIPFIHHIFTFDTNKNEFAFIIEGTEHLSYLIYGEVWPNQTLNCTFFKEGIITQKIIVNQPSFPVIQTTFFHVFKQTDFKQKYNIYKKIFLSILGIVFASIIGLSVGYCIFYCKRTTKKKNKEVNYQMVGKVSNKSNKKVDTKSKSTLDSKRSTEDNYVMFDKPL